jgi:hypothetical protein
VGARALRHAIKISSRTQQPEILQAHDDAGQGSRIAFELLRQDFYAYSDVSVEHLISELAVRPLCGNEVPRAHDGSAPARMAGLEVVERLLTSKVSKGLPTRDGITSRSRS